MNSKIIAMLSEFAEIADITGESYKSSAYLNAINSIKALSWDMSANLARVKTEKIPKIGTGIKNRIIEFITTGKVSELDKLNNDKKVKAYRVFSKIAGVGSATIKDWLRMRVYDLGTLRKRIATGKITLTHMQQCGLKYYVDLNTRINRKDVAKIGQIIRHALIQLQPDIQVEIAGSYRRGSPTSGDIDIIAAGREYDDMLLKHLIHVLESDPNFVDVMSVGNERLSLLYRWGLVRQVDILYVPLAMYHAGVLYFTGDRGFNEAMRRHAREKGYRLNQRGLFKVTKRKLQLVRVNSEREIFDILGLKYVAPEHRTARAIEPK